MKKFITILLALSLGLVLFGCSQTNDVAIESQEDVFTLQAISSTSLLNYNDLNVVEASYAPLSEVTTEATTEATTEITTETEEPIITEEVENIDKYVEMMEMFLGDENLTVVSGESDNELYQYMTTYTTLNLNRETVTYTFYYNEYVLDENQELVPNTEAENTEAQATRKFHFTDEDDNLVAVGLEGILIYGDVTYNIEGKKIVNSQQEIYRLRSYTDEDNYVVVNYQKDTTDRDREKFFFKVVEAGEVVNEAKVMMFTKADRLHLKLEFVEGEKSSSYIFNVRTEGNIQYIHITYEITNVDEYEEGSVKLTAETDPDTGEVIYSYDMSPSRGSRQYQNQFRHGNRNNMQSGTNRQ